MHAIAYNLLPQMIPRECKLNKHLGCHTMFEREGLSYIFKRNHSLMSNPLTQRISGCKPIYAY